MGRLELFTVCVLFTPILEKKLVYYEITYETPVDWAIQAVKDMDSFLQDHADAERKVANMCLSLIAKYPNRVKIIDELIQISVENYCISNRFRIQ